MSLPEKLIWHGLVYVRDEFVQSLEAQLADKSAECDRLLEDAERYRWLRDTADRDDDGHCYIAMNDWIEEGEGDDAGDWGVAINWLQGDAADAAIDAARKETP